MNGIKGFLTDDGGQDMIETSLLLVLIGAAAMFLLHLMGVSVGGIITKITGLTSQANDAIQ